MLLLDAVFINNGGGKILLDYLIERLEEKKLEVHYLLDERIRENHPNILHNKTTYLKPSLLNRHKFYKTHKFTFLKVICFGNLPPSIRLEALVFTYFHQKLFLDIPKNIPVKQHFLLKLKTILFLFLNKNTDFWMVQTELVKVDFLKKLTHTSSEKVLVLPFYPSVFENRTHLVTTRKNNFIYVSNGGSHKNHIRLIEGFKVFYDHFKTGRLTVTIGKEYSDLITLITRLQVANYPIVNAGFVDQKDLVGLYASNEYLIFPSLTESFGLGLIEAIENGCKVIGADLPYTYAVCIPSLVFDPYSIKSIANAFEDAITKKSKGTEQLVFNEIDTIIKILE